jgi:hypothetical protein
MGSGIASNHALEKATFDAVRARPFTKIMGRKPTWRQAEGLIKEMMDAALSCDVTYSWAGEFGLLAEIIGAAKYAADNPTLEPYTPPVQPPNQHAEINDGGTAAQLKQLEIENDLALRDFAMVKGFRRAVNRNVMDAIDDTYFDQLEEDVYGYKRVLPREFVVELRRWCFLTDLEIEAIKKHWSRGMQPGEHITKYAKRLTKEQKKLTEDKVCDIADSDKLHIYMLEMWKCGHFDRQTMMEWVAAPNKTFATATAFFNRKELEVEEFEQSCGGAGVRGLTGANAATEITEGVRDVVTTALEAAREQSERKDREHALAITQLKSANDTAQQQLAAITHALAAITTRLDEGGRCQHHYSDSDDSSDDESDKENTPPPKKRRKKKKKKPTRGKNDEKAAKEKPEFKVWKTAAEKKEGLEEWTAWKKKFPEYHKKEMIELARKKLKKWQDE